MADEVNAATLTVVVEFPQRSREIFAVGFDGDQRLEISPIDDLAEMLLQRDSEPAGRIKNGRPPRPWARARSCPAGWSSGRWLFMVKYSRMPTVYSDRVLMNDVRRLSKFAISPMIVPSLVVYSL